MIHTTPVHQLMACEAKSGMFLNNKSMIKMSIIHNIAFTSEKSHLIWIRREICTDQASFDPTQALLTKNSLKQF